jgi:Domain of unknown function (DUF4234)
MTDDQQDPQGEQPASTTAAAAPPTAPTAPIPYPPAQRGYGYAPSAMAGPWPVGKVRGTGVCILLSIVTLGIYPLFWYYSVHDEMKRHRGVGLGGGIALLLAFFVGIVMPFVTSSEVGDMYEARGQAKPVSGATGLWYFPGMFILVGPLVWFVKTNGALNAYWRSVGAR